MVMDSKAKKVFDWYINNQVKTIDLLTLAAVLSGNKIISRRKAIEFLGDYFKKGNRTGRISNFVNEAQYLELRKKSKVAFLEQVFHDLANNYKVLMIGKILGYPVSKLRDPIDPRELELQKLHEQLSKAEAEMNQLLKQSNELQMSNDKIDKYWSGTFSDLREKYDKLHSENVELKTANNKLQAQAKELEVEKVRLDNERKKLQKEHEDQHDNYGQRLDKLRIQEIVQKELQTKYEREVNRFKEEYEELQKKEQAEYKKKLQSLEKTLDQLYSENTAQQKEIDRLKTNGAQLAESVEKWQDRYAQLKKEYEALEKNKVRYTYLQFENDQQVLEVLEENAKAKGLVYDKDTLQNFHIAIKTAPLTILEGVSGTGKSQLVSLYAKTIGLDADHVRILPVSPSWTDDTDILGYYDAEQHRYIEAETELVEMLRDAEAHPQDLYIVCFDEMNLAKVEHYFAKFLSLLEKDENERDLLLFSRNQTANNGYERKVKIGDNVRFCGTINIDESTFRLSDKVLDRSIVITLPKPDISDLRKMESDSSAKKTQTELKVIDSYAMTEERKDIGLESMEVLILKEIDKLLTEYDPKFGVAARVYKYFSRYLAEVTDNNLENDLARPKAFDLLIAQKLLPKIRGTREQVGELFGFYNKENDEVEASKLRDMLDEFEKASYFQGVTLEVSRNKIEEKARLLEAYGYID